MLLEMHISYIRQDSRFSQPLKAKPPDLVRGQRIHRSKDKGATEMMAETPFSILIKFKPDGKLLSKALQIKHCTFGATFKHNISQNISSFTPSGGARKIIKPGQKFKDSKFTVTVVSLICSIVTEFITSNAATATLLVPLLYHIAGTMHVHPLILIIPGGIATEFAFWLPTSTPSNVVGFATGHIEIKDMFKVGVPLKVVGIVVLSLLMPSLGELPTNYNLCSSKQML